MVGNREHKVVLNELPAETDSVPPAVYQIQIEGQLGCEWTEWFGDMTITQDDGETLLTGPVIDQAALFGLLKKVRDLGMSLVSVNRVHPC
jgi:hypothetical protein